MGPELRISNARPDGADGPHLAYPGTSPFWLLEPHRPQIESFSLKEYVYHFSKPPPGQRGALLAAEAASFKCRIRNADEAKGPHL